MYFYSYCYSKTTISKLLKIITFIKKFSFSVKGEQEMDGLQTTNVLEMMKEYNKEQKKVS